MSDNPIAFALTCEGRHYVFLRNDIKGRQRVRLESPYRVAGQVVHSTWGTNASTNVAIAHHVKKEMELIPGHYSFMECAQPVSKTALQIITQTLELNKV